MGEWHARTIESGVVVLRPAGRLNAITAPDLREQLHALVGRGSTRLVLDLSALTSVDSSGLGAIISGLKVARKAGGDLKIVAPNERVQLVLRLARVETILKSYETVDRCFAGPAPNG